MKNILNTSGGGSKITTLLVPTTSSDNAIVRWDGTSGQSIQNSGIFIDDNNNLRIPLSTSTDGRIFFGDDRIISASNTNLLLGKDSGLFITTGRDNILIGLDSGVSMDTGRRNIGLGNNTLETLESGENNIALGYFGGASIGAAINDTITIGNSGSSSIDGDIRIGNDLDHLRVFISGIKDKTPSGTNEMVIIDENNQLGSQAIPASGRGDVVGANGSIVNTVVRFADTTGKILKSSSIVMTDTNVGNLFCLRNIGNPPTGNNNTLFGTSVMNQGSTNYSNNTCFGSNIMNAGSIDSTSPVGFNTIIGANACQDTVTLGGGSFSFNTIIGQRCWTRFI